MGPARLLRRNLAHYWRGNLAVIAGVATAVSVLAGALLVGASVRGSLHELVVGRLGRTQTVITSTGFFRDRLAQEFGDACPLIVREGFVTNPQTGRRAASVFVYGVDDRFWKFHRLPGRSLAGRGALVGESLAAELGIAAGSSLLVRFERPSEIPAESLHGRKEDSARAVRFTARAVAPAAALGEFSLRPRQGAVHTLFVPLELLQGEFEQPGKVNTLLLGSGAPPAEDTLRRGFTFEDVGLRLRLLPRRDSLQVETASGVLGDALAEIVNGVAARTGLQSLPMLTYLANSIRAGDRQIPYSLVTAVDLAALRTAPAPASIANPIVLNDWAARDLAVQPPAQVTLDYYLWSPDGRLLTETASFQLAAVVSMQGLAGDRDLAPLYPGITDTDDLGDWDPPFPMNLRLIRPRDEDYWDSYRTTPKAFVGLERGRELWQSRFGKLTAIRLLPAAGMDLAAAHDLYGRALRAALDPLHLGFSVTPLRRQSLEASRGATDFGEYFLYFSFFLVGSALLLVGLFFRLGVEQRSVEIGLLEAVGLPAATVRKLFLTEGALLAATGGLLGLAGAGAYAALILLGLRTWWVDAVGTRLLTLHLSPAPLALGVLGGVLTALVTIAGTLRWVRRSSPRNLLSGGIWVAAGAAGRARSKALLAGLAAALSGLALLGAALAGALSQAAGFFGAGVLLLAASLLLWRHRLSHGRPRAIAGTGSAALARLALRNTSIRPGRTVMCGALIASASFLIVSVEAFRRPPQDTALDPFSGAGGYPLQAESQSPLLVNLNTPAGREGLNLSAAEPVRFIPFRLRPGDDTSCLNLYRPQNPRVLGASTEFLHRRRFSFASSLAATAAQRENPWLLLEAPAADGTVPAIADANSMTYVLHRKLGEEILVHPSSGPPVRLRLVASLDDSIFQSELVISERSFLRLFPEQQGWRFFLLEAPGHDAARFTGVIENALADYGFDIVTTAERLAGFHRVENTYLSTFQSLGAMGLLLGTLGMAAVLFRNVMERRRELALLAAVGYRARTLSFLLLAESALLLAAGTASGTLAAVVAVSPALASRVSNLPLASIGALLAAVLASGLTASALATLAALRLPLGDSLRGQ